MSEKKLKIFVHSASVFLTDYESHGEGLICFSLLNGLAKMGHKIVAFTPKSSIKNKSDNLIVFESTGSMPFNSLSPWKYSLEANRLFKRYHKEFKFDFVWRMNPFGYDCPLLPTLENIPLIIGPMYYRWPESNARKANSRYGLSLRKWLEPYGILGWKKTLKKSKLIFCATKKHADELKNLYNIDYASELPLMVDNIEKERVSLNNEKIKIIFLANFHKNKRPLVFCEIINILKNFGKNVEAKMLGDGPEIKFVKEYIEENNLSENIELLGSVDNHLVRSYLVKADYFINTAIGEPYGRSVIEAMASGCIVLNHNSGGPKDFLENMVTGILTEEESAESFANELIKIDADEEKKLIISQNALKKSFEWRPEAILQKLESQLKLVLS